MYIMNALDIEKLTDSELLNEIKDFKITSIEQPETKNRKWNDLLKYEIVITNTVINKIVYRMNVYKYQNGKNYMADDIKTLCNISKQWCRSFNDLDRSNGWKIIEAIDRGLITFNFQEKAV